MQMICHYTVTAYDAWKQAFDADDESRRNAGLSVLQVWRHADSDTHAFVLMEVANRTRAQDWLDRSAALSTDDGGTVLSASPYFIETA